MTHIRVIQTASIYFDGYTRHSEVERYASDRPEAAEMLGAMLLQWRAGVEDVRAGA